MRLIEVKAKNFMRFHEVELRFPERGLFCIQGANESGKSTIGKLIYFCLTGEGSQKESPHSLINWEKNQMKVKLTFEHCGETFQIMRQVDRDGTNFSKCAKGSQVLAQGNQPILNALEQEMGYPPRLLMESFLITHRVVQNLVQSPSLDHLDDMVGLSPLKALCEGSEKGIADRQAELTTLTSRESSLSQEQHSVDYQAEAEAKDVEELAKVGEEIEKLKAEVEQKGSEINSSRNLHDSLEKILRSLPKEIQPDQDQEELQSTQQQFGQLSFRGGHKDQVESIVAQFSNLVDYGSNRKQFLEAYQNQLDELRARLGVEGSTPEEGDSLEQKVERHREQSTNHEKSGGRWVGIAFLFGLVHIAYSVAVVLRQKLITVVDESGFGPWLDELRAMDAWGTLAENFRPGAWFGLPVSPLPWALFLLFFFLWFLPAFIASRKLSKAKSENALREALEKERDDLKSLYHEMLSVDTKEMEEVTRIVEEKGNEETIAKLQEMREQHPNLASQGFSTVEAEKELKHQLNQLSGDIAADIASDQEQRQQLETSILELQEAQGNLQGKVEDWAKRKEKHEKLELDLQALRTELQNNRHEHAIETQLMELARGTVESVRRRLRRDLTQHFKNLMPIITSERYASIRFGENFEIEVFSEERGDFVPLGQLSSGTNDLFVLVFQIVLLQGFMDAREHDQHFIFLDEPLLAVDATRYGKLAELLPGLSDGMGQIFLCRPPQNAEATVIETRLEDRTLVADFRES